MRKLIGLVVLGSLLAGCGGGNLLGALTGNPFLGQYSGTFTTSLGDSGTTDFTVITDGKFSGTIHRNSDSADAVLAGTIDDNGNVTATAAFPTAIGLTGQVTMVNGNMTGTLDQSVGGTLNGTVNLDVNLK